jgi:hypothetical protein
MESNKRNGSDKITTLDDRDNIELFILTEEQEKALDNALSTTSRP